MVDPFSYKQCTCTLLMDPQTLFFNNFFIKNVSHNTIYTFKNYFVIVFSVFSFLFQKNKFYSNKHEVVFFFFKTEKVEFELK